MSNETRVLTGEEAERFAAINDILYADTSNVVKANRLEALIQQRLAETEKAYGGCRSCYGKGYSSYSGVYSARGMSWPDDNVKFCWCDRGKQLESMTQQRARKAMSVVMSEIHEVLEFQRNQTMKGEK